MRSVASSSRVRRAMDAVPRVRFLPVNQQAMADADTALAIDCGQTISQPSLVAYMTEQLSLNRASRVLEIGTGSGYQTAILAELAAEVFTIERIEPLAQAARARLGRLGYRNIRLRVGDGAEGWPEAAPFDAVLVTAAAQAVPPALLAQLLPTGKMVIPVGKPHSDQDLWLIEGTVDGPPRMTRLLEVRFVPLVTDQR